MQSKRQTGFTLVEILITLVLVAFLSLAAMQMLGPWLLFKSKIDTDRKLQDLRLAFIEVYQRNPLRIDDVNSPVLTLETGDVVSSPLIAQADGGQACEPNEGFQLMKSYLSNGPHDAQVDGFNSPFCVFVSDRLSRPVDGTTLYFHNIAVVSPGSDGVITSVFDPVIGELTVNDDDIGTLIDGFGIQYDKYKITLGRLDKVSDLYSSYFSARFLANPGRDVSVDYFSSEWDTTGPIASTAGTPQPINVILAPLGANDIDSRAPYEDLGAVGTGRTNDIFMENYNSCIPLVPTANCPPGNLGSTSCLCVRSPATGAIPPYTALVSTRLPGGSTVSKTIVGHY